MHLGEVTCSAEHSPNSWPKHITARLWSRTGATRFAHALCEQPLPWACASKVARSVASAAGSCVGVFQSSKRVKSLCSPLASRWQRIAPIEAAGSGALRAC